MRRYIGKLILTSSPGGFAAQVN